ncbi:MAG: SH3 domain-containing protein [Lachnospiraceae bacterium]|nr:SH3 domain-containing protein [Lachnospiraceae bacterium]
MAKDFDDEWEDDFIDIDISANRTGKKNEAPQESQTQSEAAARPVKKMEKVLDDPLAESESTEDIYSGRYKRDTSDRGVYTGGTRKDRMMDSTDTAEDRARRMERRRKERKRKTLILIIVAVIVVCAAAFAVYRSGILSPGGDAETSSEEESSSETEESTAEALSVAWDEDNAEVTELVTSYYTALAEADTESLETLVDEAVEIDADSLASQAEIIESYEDISAYVTDGENEGEYAVFIVYSTKFADIDTAAPGMTPAYVKTDSEGTLRLLTYQYFDDAVTEYMTALSNTEEILALSEEVQTAYEQAQEEDEDLKTFIAALSSTGEETETSAEDEEETSGEDASSEETTADETTTSASDSGEITFEEVDNIQYAIDNVKCRTTPSTEGEDYELVMMGDWVHVIGESDEWYKVVLSTGTVGYIYSEYLSPYQPETTEAADEEAE